MPNLKDIRRRIRSVKSTQKITQAMKMVAAAKVKRAENKVKSSRAYSEELRILFRDVYEAVKNQISELEDFRYLDLLRQRPVKTVGIVVLTSDRGLCGSYNATIIKQALLLGKRYEAEGLTPKYYLVGNKAIRTFASMGQSDILGTLGNISSAPSLHDAHTISDALFDAYHRREIDAIQVLYTRFVSMISYKPTLRPVFPLKGVIDEIEHIILPEDGHVHEVEQPGSPTTSETLLEPNPTNVLETLVPLYLSNQIYIALLEGSASELAARMTAMSNASNNAADMIGKLTILYNKARQAAITQEILEIVSGAQALS